MILKTKLVATCLLLFSALVVQADDRFERGIVGEIVAVETTRSPATITIQFEETQTKLNLDIAKNAKVTVAFDEAALSDLKPGTLAALQLADDHRTVQSVQAAGKVEQVTIRTIDAARNIITASLEEDEDNDEDEDNEDDDNETNQAARPQPREFLISPAARLRIGGLPATLAELQPGMNVPLELSKDGKSVHGIDAEAAEGTIVEGRITSLDVATKTIKAMIEADDQETEQSFVVAISDNITLDGKKISLADLKPGCGVALRLAASKATIQAISVSSPEADDE